MGTGYNLQVMAANALQEFLTSERAREEAERLEHERQQKEKDRILRRIMNANIRMQGVGFRQSFQWMEAKREEERQLIFRQRGIMNRIVDTNSRLMGMGFNKLIEEWKARQAETKDKMKFILKSLTDRDARFMLCAYNGLTQRANMLNGVGMDNAEQKKIQLIKRLTNQGYNMQVMACNALQEFLSSERAREIAAKLEYERQQKEKKRILGRIMDSNLRAVGTGFRQSHQWMIEQAERERQIAFRQRGIMKRIVDSNVRIMSAGYNKLLEEWKSSQASLKEKLRYIIKSLTDNDARMTLCAYNGLKQRRQLLNGVGIGNTGMLKIQLIKRLTNQAFNLQVMAINTVREFLKDEGAKSEDARLAAERLRKEQEKICRRILNTELNLQAS